MNRTEDRSRSVQPDAGELILKDLHIRHPGVSPELAAAYYAVACVCLARHRTSPASIVISSSPEASSNWLLQWQEPAVDWVRSFSNVDEATRDGAYCVALACVESVMRLVALRRAEGATGADYYLIPSGTDPGEDPHLDLERDDLLRLEVSGIDKDTDPRMASRLMVKLGQLRRGRSGISGLAVVVGFRTPQIRAGKS